jgi:thiamine-phosphate pyrophosphorylase
VSFPAKLPRTPILCYVTDRNSLHLSSSPDSRGELLKRIAGAASAGIDWIQIREKDLTGKDVGSTVRDSLTLARQANRQNGQPPRILVNDRIDVACTERAGGVHVGENSLPVRDVSEWIHTQWEKPAARDFLVGVSCHSLESAMAAMRDGADYIFFGPLFATPSKAEFGAPQGLRKLKEICEAVSIPVLAIGGITVKNASSCLGAGAAGIAAIRLFQDAVDLPAVVSQLRGAHH